MKDRKLIFYIKGNNELMKVGTMEESDKSFCSNTSYNL